MHAMEPSLTARVMIRHLLEPRRVRFRYGLMRVMLEHAGASRIAREETLEKVHDLCAKELAERVRIAGDALRRAWTGTPEVGMQLLLGELREEIMAVLDEETGDLAEDERLVTILVDRLPGFLPDRLDPKWLQA